MERSYEAEIRDFILQNFLFREERASIPDDESLLQSGVMDSTGVLELVAYLEERFGIEVEDAEMIPENLDSIGGVVSYVRGKASRPPTEASGAPPETGTEGPAVPGVGTGAPGTAA